MTQCLNFIIKTATAVIDINVFNKNNLLSKKKLHFSTAGLCAQASLIFPLQPGLHLQPQFQNNDYIC